jgi:hypothetical protein
VHLRPNSLLEISSAFNLSIEVFLVFWQDYGVAGLKYFLFLTTRLQGWLSKPNFCPHAQAIQLDLWHCSN